MATASEIRDLRTALASLQQQGEGIVRWDTPVDCAYELAAIYAERAGGVPVRPPTKAGPVFLFEQALPQHRSVLVGLFGDRSRCARLLRSENQSVSQMILDAIESPIAPRHCADPVCQQVIETNVNLNTLPITTLTRRDAGRYITMGLCLARDPTTGAQNISVHRLCQQSDQTLSIYMVPGRHLAQMYVNAKAKGMSLPISINIGLDPAIYIASCCPTTLAPFGVSELGIAGGLRRRAVQVSACQTIAADCISHAEYVLEAELLPECIPENAYGEISLPEFLGYDGEAHPSLPLVQVKAITHREDPVFQTVIGPGYEQSNLAAFGMEAAVLDFVHRNSPSHFLNAYCSSAGGGVLLLFLQVDKTSLQDDTQVRHIGIALLETFKLLKTIVLVDGDVDVSSEEDVWWAMATRFQADRDLITLPSMQGFALDPSQHPDFSPSISNPGMTAKTVMDCTVPFQLKGRFQRSQFM